MTIEAVSFSRKGSTTALAPTSSRGRVLLFDGNDQAVTTAAPALAGLGIEVLRSSITAKPLAASTQDVLAVVVAGTDANARATTDLVRHLRSVTALPVLLLAAQMQDDVLLQEVQPSSSNGSARLVPFDLAQQIRAILRRAPSRVLRFGLLEIDIGGREVHVDNQAVELSRREFDLIAFLASSPGHAFTRRELLQTVWHSSGEWQTPSTVTEHVRRIRSKLQTKPDVPNWLVTVRGTGYRFQA